MSGARVEGHVGVTPASVHTILDKEAQKATGKAARLRAAATNQAAPVGKTQRLGRSHRASVRRTPFGYVGALRRAPEAWYGRIVERGRRAGRSQRTGRRYPGARANPFVTRAELSVRGQAERALDAGADAAAARIESRIVSR